MPKSSTTIGDQKHVNRGQGTLRFDKDVGFVCLSLSPSPRATREHVRAHLSSPLLSARSGAFRRGPPHVCVTYKQNIHSSKTQEIH